MSEKVTQLDRIRELQKRLQPVQSTTPPYNPAFPNQNQSKYCWSAFVLYQWCLEKHGIEDDKEEYVPVQCQSVHSVAAAMCPKYWMDKWGEEKDAGLFPRYWPSESTKQD
jgi:cytochrome c oxidase subunit 6b